MNSDGHISIHSQVLSKTFTVFKSGCHLKGRTAPVPKRVSCRLAEVRKQLLYATAYHLTKPHAVNTALLIMTISVTTTSGIITKRDHSGDLQMFNL